MSLDLYALLLIVLVLIGIRVAPKQQLFSEHGLDREQSVALRGVLCIMIMLDHSALLTQVGMTSIFFKKAAFFVVGLFFALSGYGLTASWQRAGGSIRGFWGRRFKSTLLPYLLLSVVAAIVRLLIGERLTLGQVLFSFVNGKPLVRYSWFVLVLIAFYALFYLAALLARGDKALLAALVGFASILLPFAMRKLGFEEYWYDAVWTFPLGMLWQMTYGRIVEAVRKHPWVYLALSAACAGWFILISMYFYWFSYLGTLLATISVVVFIFLLMLKLRIGNPILHFLGRISLEIYLIHGIVVTVLEVMISPTAQPLLFLAILFPATILLAWLFHKFCHWLFCSGHSRGAETP